MISRLVFVMGAPRSGTTFAASTIAKAMGVPLFPETQFLETAASAVGPSCPRWNAYSVANWPELKSSQPTQDLRRLLDCAVTARYTALYSLRSGESESLAFVDHTPQNVLVLGRIRQTFPEALLVCCVRSPTQSILSLASQDWFEGSIFNAIFYNCRCLFSAIRRRNDVDIFLRVGESRILGEVCDLACESADGFLKVGGGDNWYLNSSELNKSHEYLHSAKKTKYSLFQRFAITVIAVPNWLAYGVLHLWVIPKSRIARADQAGG